jgi:hypothetical protein
MWPRISGASPSAFELERSAGTSGAIAPECVVSATAYANLDALMVARAGGMSTAVIHGERLGKQYSCGLQTTGGLRHSLEDFLRSPVAPLRRKKEDTFWALKDVSLEVKEGGCPTLGVACPDGVGTL